MGDAKPEPYFPFSRRIPIDYKTGRPGPCVVVFAGLHGDEKGGPEALERVSNLLRDNSLPLCGRFIGVHGNIAALAANERFIERDLNRGWYEEDIVALGARDPGLDRPEDREQRALMEFVDTLNDEPNRPVIYLDLHSTSAHGLPFICMPDTIENLRIARHIPIPGILGLEETINGPLAGLLSDRGFAGVIVEGGHHEDQQTRDVLESSIIMLLAGVGSLTRAEIPGYEKHRKRLTAMCYGLPRVLEIKHRHDITDHNGFKMRTGFRHYDRVERDQHLADNNAGPIRAPLDARIIMPAYRVNTDQGFFLARDIEPVRVLILFLLRRLGLHRICHWLPGASIDPDNSDLMRIASWVPPGLVDIVRLLGWRRTRTDNDQTLLKRRRVRS